ncbi:hypothetical protein LEP1GSC016_3929 [Leptospira borgpetersenii serovar Hardjo-bovis str. Sponselee]|uniref:Uncharacterized protein n=1 Tax=Leptospira borgpetersenii serovar Hardjo-bovis str. Sponselee TaxID=1303729 RepID=M6BMM2_LEPBO|nr:hypothetical protein LEP1GSC016_3929 [Leptospira borgpetersenii serovar Hardjo-bovis str. Sponselee]
MPIFFGIDWNFFFTYRIAQTLYFLNRRDCFKKENFLIFRDEG